MKIILCSEFHQVADKLLLQGCLDKEKKKVAFIQNATDARHDAGESKISRVEAGKEWYINNGFDLEVIDLRTTQGKTLENRLKTCNYIHIHGGDVKRITKLAKESGLYNIIKELLQSGIIYIGSSAGSILAGSYIDYSFIGQQHPSPIELEKNTQGFGLYPFFLVPHSGRMPILSAKQERLAYCENHSYSPYLTLADHQAIVLEDGKFEFIE